MPEVPDQTNSDDGSFYNGEWYYYLKTTEDNGSSYILQVLENSNVPVFYPVVSRSQIFNMTSNDDSSFSPLKKLNISYLPIG